MQRRHVPVGAALPASSSRRTACASSRAGASRSTSRRASTSSSASTWSRRARRAAARVRSAEEAARRPKGLFDAARKRPLPALPRKIGIVTSLDGAAHPRHHQGPARGATPNAHLVIRPARVQGDGAAPEIARALRAIGRVAGRGRRHRRARRRIDRGSLGVQRGESSRARSPASPVPVISAVGHETDVTIADFVADVARADAVGARRELVVARKDEFCAPRSIGCTIGCTPRRAARIQRAEPPRPRRRAAGRRSRVTRPARDARPRRRVRCGPRADASARQCSIGCDATPLSTLRAPARHVRRRPPAGRAADAARRGRRPLDAARRCGAARSRRRATSHSVVRPARVTLSPLAVLGRGYAVCWNADRTPVAPRRRVGRARRHGPRDLEPRRD
mgnify:CR=1 FL=1